MNIPENYIKKLNHKNDSFITNFIEQNFSKEIFFNSEIMDVMRKIFFDMSYVYESLEFLDKAGIEFNLTLAGGSLRDLFAEKYDSIKDLDIILYFNNIEGYSILPKENMLSNLENNIVLVETFEACKIKYDNWDNWNIDKKLTALVEISLGKMLNVQKVFIPLDLPLEIEEKDLCRSNYHNKFLRGVIKMTDKKLNYPIDILISNTYAEKYVETFDFNICKIMLEISSKQFKEMLMKFDWETLETIKNQIVPLNEFWFDFAYKKLTINPIGYDILAVQRSIVDHLPKIKEKFENHEIKLLQYQDSSFVSQDVKNYLAKANDLIDLNGSLITKEDSINIIKNLIK